MNTMLTEYIQAAMARAHYEVIENGDEPYYGEIPGIDGVWAVGSSLEETRDELRSALEDWILFGLDGGLRIPPLDGIDISRPALVEP
jgi:predicted RNase H-like HicB family nuclease